MNTWSISSGVWCFSRVSETLVQMWRLQIDVLKSLQVWPTFDLTKTGLKATTIMRCCVCPGFWSTFHQNCSFDLLLILGNRLWCKFCESLFKDIMLQLTQCTQGRQAHINLCMGQLQPVSPVAFCQLGNECFTYDNCYQGTVDVNNVQ